MWECVVQHGDAQHGGPEHGDAQHGQHCQPFDGHTLIPCSDDATSDIAPVDCATIACAFGGAVSVPDTVTIALADFHTDRATDVKPLAAAVDCSDGMWLCWVESLRGRADDKHAHTGTVAFAIFRADSAAELGAIGCPIGGPVHVTSELRCTDCDAIGAADTWSE
jgi:hypothetical protein